MRRFAILLLLATVAAGPVPTPDPPPSTRVVVRMQAGATPSSVGDVVKVITDDTFVVDVPATIDPSVHRGVVWAQPEVRYRATKVPDDPCFGSCPINLGGQRNLAAVRAEEAWDVTTGSEAVVVAVVDTVVDGSHPDLTGKVIAGRDLRASSCIATDALLAGHGTAVASIIAARTDDGVGIASLGWNTTVLAVPVLDDCGWADASTVAAGIRAAVDAGVRVVNLSLAGPAHRAVEEAIADAHRRGVLVVAAAGNDPNEIAYPAAYPDVIAVGSVDAAGEQRSPWSGRGAWVDIAAPGEHVLSAAPALGGYWFWDGTSMAAPLVSAAAALSAALHPHFDANDLAYSLVRSARPSGAGEPPVLDAARLLRPTAGGLVLLGRDGGVLTYGDAAFHGSAAGIPLRAPVVGIAAAGRAGYWLAAADGGVFSYGTPFLGSAASLPLRSPVVAIAATPSGGGYWLAAADGGIFTFGDAPFLGSAVGTVLDRVVSMAATPTGRGYLLVTAGGTVRAFGDARWSGDGRQGTVAIATSIGRGYWLVSSSGHVEPRGGAPAIGATQLGVHGPVVALAPAPGRGGYWAVTADGRPLAAGNALDDGQIQPPPTAPIVAAASTES